jgi:hypothetical protein
MFPNSVQHFGITAKIGENEVEKKGLKIVLQNVLLYFRIKKT